MTKYAADTSVPVERSRAEIERLLVKYGATKFAYYADDDRAAVAFQVHNRRVRFELPMPERGAREFTHTPGRGLVRTPDEAFRAWEQACRQRWRALALVIRAKLEAVACGITSFESEFLAHIVLPNNRTVGEWFGPQLEAAYSTGKMPPLLGAGDGN